MIEIERKCIQTTLEKKNMTKYGHKMLPGKTPHQCWTEGRSSTAVAEGFRPTAMATVAEVLGHSYGRR